MGNTAGKRLLIDTCYACGISGRQDTQSLAKRSASVSFSLLAPVKENEESQENPQLGHGIFTWALMQTPFRRKNAHNIAHDIGWCRSLGL